ncbi:MAG TPA: DUF2314 domain-containing protein [Burkholderiales bacterium]
MRLHALAASLVLAGAMACATALAQTILEKSERDEVTRMSDEEPAMARAFERARRTLDHFLRLHRSPPPDTRGYAVKVGISEGANTEYFWITPFSVDGERFRGRLSNEPRLVTHVRNGQEIAFGRSDIVDWMYVDVARRRMHGNFTACALLSREPPEDAARFRARFGLQCDP